MYHNTSTPNYRDVQAVGDRTETCERRAVPALVLVRVLQPVPVWISWIL